MATGQWLHGLPRDGLKTSTPSETHTYDTLSEVLSGCQVQSPFSQPLTGKGLASMKLCGYLRAMEADSSQPLCVSFAAYL